MKAVTKLMFMAAVLFIVIGMQSAAIACIAVVPNDPLLTGEISPVSFYAVDTNSDNTVSLTNLNFTLNPGTALEAIYNGGSQFFTSPYANLTITMDTTNYELITFQLVDAENHTNVFDKDASLLFTGWYGTDQQSGLELYSGVTINWDDVNSIVIPTQGDGGVSPAPIPSAALLLGSGLIGLIGFRRQVLGR